MVKHQRRPETERKGLVKVLKSRGLRFLFTRDHANNYSGTGGMTKNDRGRKRIGENKPATQTTSKERERDSLRGDGRQAP